MRNNRKIALMGAFIALAMVLSYFESFIPVFIAVPGVKPGLANIVTIIALKELGLKDAFVISIARIILSGILFGNITVILYSLAGAILSILAMSFLSKIKIFSVTGISIIGGVMHNLGQVIMASLLLDSGSIMYYMAVLTVTGTVSGALVGILAGIIITRIDFSGKN